MEDILAKQTYGAVALQKMAPIPPNFRLYEAGWLETGAHPSTWDVMEVKGAVFREATKGPRKGKLCIQVPNTKITAYVTRAEMKAYEDSLKAAEPEYKYESNSCTCHPETCGCNPFKITDREGNKLTTAYTEEQAKKVVEILNK
jgi:hypothetical protein